MVSSRLEMRGISLAFSGFQALSRVDFTLTGGSVHADRRQRRGEIDADGGAVRDARPL
jgi:hypothetical protein